MNPVSACMRALEIGLTGITFTDHLDYDYPGFGNEFNIDFDAYSKSMDDLKEKFKDKLTVLKGIEVGIQPHTIEDTKKALQSSNFDFVISSVHIIDRQDPYVGEYYKTRTKHEAYLRYLQEIVYSLNHFDDFDILGHIDYIIRYGCYDDRSLAYDEFIDTIDEILKRLVQLGKGMEVNTRSYRDKEGIKTPVYDIKILKRYKELGGEIITLGSDAHSIDSIGYKFDYFKEMIKNAGFKYTAYFTERKPNFIPL